MNSSDPSKILDREDSGGDTQRRFRYQHGYGVILLCGSATGQLPYVAVWCEHHEDLLGEKSNGQFDSFQIKTATPEYGHWKISNESLQKSIGRFAELDLKFPGKFDTHSFVSNVQCYDTKQVGEIAKSPIKFFFAVRDCEASTGLSPVHMKTLEELATKLDCDKTKLFDTCKRVKIVKGPPLDGFETSIAHEHMPKLDGCSALAPARLDGLRDELIQIVFNASSIKIDDPNKHWCCVLGDDHVNPRLKAKRLTVRDVFRDALAERPLVFRFAPSRTSLKLGDEKRELEILNKKLLRGGLGNQLDSMQSRTLSAEQHLLALVAQDVDEAGKVINQLTEVVQCTCCDAQALASAGPEPWGMEMYRRVVGQLMNMANNRPEMVHHQPHECLMGLAGLLTEECKVWWSPKFDAEEPL